MLHASNFQHVFSWISAKRQNAACSYRYKTPSPRNRIHINNELPWKPGNSCTRVLYELLWESLIAGTLWWAYKQAVCECEYKTQDHIGLTNVSAFTLLPSSVCWTDIRSASHCYSLTVLNVSQFRAYRTRQAGWQLCFRPVPGIFSLWPFLAEQATTATPSCLPIRDGSHRPNPFLI